MAVKVHENGYGKWVAPIVTVIVILAVLIASVVVISFDSSSVNLNEDSKHIEIASGEGIDTVSEKLKENGIIKFPFVFKLQAVLGGYKSNIQPGAATITNGMSYDEILNLLSQSNRETVKVVIPEGYEIKQIAEKLCEEGLANWNDFYDALNPGDYDYEFLKNLPERENVMEGYLFPATYEIPYGMSEHDIIDLMLSAFDNQFKPEYYSRASELGMTADQVITMASIVERETDSDTERAKVAGVFYNRRNSGMKFQSCATVQYILGERKPVLSIADTQIDSPYNTYLYADFPIGPICNPGIACIEAALYPEATDAYYFVLGKNGEHIFSKTYDEHLAAMQGMEMNVSVDDSVIENEDDKISR